MGGKKFLPREQPYRSARNGAARRGRACGPRPARDHVAAKNTGSMEKCRSAAGRCQRQSVLGAIDSLHAPVGLIDGGVMDCGKHRRASVAFAGGTNATDSLYRA